MASKKRGYEHVHELAYEDSNELINQVIARLAAPADPLPTNVSTAYSNDLSVSNEVQAYAKIAGRSWTFYVKKLKVSVGRNTESHGSVKAVDIDLGPSKVVSRRHAVIEYNLELRRWELFVYGRNGVKVDGTRLYLPYGTPYVLSSGNILDIGGTEMMLILPDAAPSIADSFLEGVDVKKRKGTGVRAFQMYNKAPAVLSLVPSATAGGVMGDGALDQDYSKDEARDMKPPYSYATMITQAILSNTQGVLSLSEIYDWIASHFAYYRFSKQGWQNSIRHNLSLNKAFEKVPRRANEPGKGMKWQISEAYRQDFLKKWRDGTLNKGKRGTSVARQLQLHLMRNHRLPESGRTPVPTLPKKKAQRHTKTKSDTQSAPDSAVASRVGSGESADTSANDSPEVTSPVKEKTRSPDENGEGPALWNYVQFSSPEKKE